MKTFTHHLASIVVAAFVTAPALHADITGYPSTNTNSGTTGAATVSSIGPNSRTWTLPPNTNLPAAIATNAALTNSHQLVELQTGMNFWDGSQWSPSVATFQTVSNGFAATQTQHKIFLNSQINTRSSVTVTTPDGTNLYSSPVAIALYDAASGNLAIIGTITNSSGVMVNSNQIAYPSAFAGVCADVVYTIERGALHQDVYLTGSINPADYNFPSNTTRIQIITELYNPPTPERIIRPVHVEQNQTVRAQMVTPDLIDEMLGFGHFTFGAGRAYMVPKATPQDAGAPVGKQLLNVNGRMLLVESVEYKSIWRGMAYLPQCNGGTNASGGSLHGMLNAGKGKAAYAAVPTPPRTKSLVASPKPVPQPKTGVASIAPRGLVIDYTADVGSMDDPTLFQSDTTYFIAGQVYCDGATTIEGAVFKYPLAVGDFSSGASITMGNSLTLAVSSYRPAIFTAADDDSAGSKMNTGPYASYYTGNPGTNYNSGTGYGWPYLSLACSVSTLSHLNFCYAQEALYINGEASSAPVTVAHSQFVNCIQGIELDTGSYAVLTLNNCLLHNVQQIFTDEGSEGDAYYLCNCTLHQTSNTVTLMTSDSGPAISSVNGVFVNIIESATTFTGNNNGFYNSTANGTAYTFAYVNPFDTAVSGAHYLDPSSGFLGVGTTNIDSGLLADLRTMTTRAPPVILSNVTLVESFTLYPQISRDTNVASVDLGYHYDPIDFLVNNVTVSNYNSLTLTSGVVVATYGSVGINLSDNSQFLSGGTPLTHNYLTQTRAVQESPDAWAAATTYYPLNPTEATLFVFLRFTDVTFLPKAYPYDNLLLGGTVPIQLLLQDCRLSGAGFWYEVDAGDTAMPQMELHNNVLERCYLDVADASEDGSYVSAGVDWFNNLFFGGKVLVDHFTGTWEVRDNIFDSGSIWDGSSTTSFHNHNAFINMSTAFSGTDTGSHTLSSFTYAAGPLGAYYQPSGSALLNQGSRAANLAGLYHYTVSTSETKEGTSTVTIGPHYVALNSYGQPDNYSGDGIPDYLKDSNGDGSYDTGDLGNWLASSSSGGVSGWILYLEGRNLNVSTAPSADTTGITHLQVYTPLK